MIDRLRGWWNRPIPDERRLIAFALAALVIGVAGVAAIVATAAREGQPPRDQPAAVERPAAPAAAPSARPPAELAAEPVPGEEDRPPAGEAPRPGDIAAAKRAGREFLAGYLAFSYGRGDARRLRAATPALRRALAGSPPRVPPGERGRRGRLETLQVDGASRRRMGLLALVDDGRRRYSLALALARYPGGWRVTDVGA